MLYIVYIIKIGPALRKKVKSRETYDFSILSRGIQCFFGNLKKSREIQRYLGKWEPCIYSEQIKNFTSTLLKIVVVQLTYLLKNTHLLK